MMSKSRLNRFDQDLWHVSHWLRRIRQCCGCKSRSLPCRYMTCIRRMVGYFEVGSERVLINWGPGEMQLRRQASCASRLCLHLEPGALQQLLVFSYVSICILGFSSRCHRARASTHAPAVQNVDINGNVVEATLWIWKKGPSLSVSNEGSCKQCLFPDQLPGLMADNITIRRRL